MTKIIAHRGSKSNRPENTIIAFQEALRVGADGIELDVHMTKDGHLMVIHDERIDRTTSGRGLVRKMTMADIKAFDAGSWFFPEFFRERVPSLEEVLLFLEESQFDGELNIEVKTDKYPYCGIEKALSELMQSRQWSFDYYYSSFNLFTLYRMSKFDSGIELAFLMKEEKHLMWLANKLPFIQTLHPHRKAFFKSLTISIPKSYRLWTVNRTEDMQKAFRLGVKGFFTDNPEEALRQRELDELNTTIVTSHEKSEQAGT
ncbi:glycerophosphodiester phosphodiesterase [Streptococcus moroccensis]|uniref:Glycerophosphoryl diester phosphodiesterase n=1 Tax=Streptococcus moroccensis TaxID=1451356 RepID=A0ABT9YSQ2_9STRE|nr:glycerophosphodiester phosphodiesterase [Streptococcus moroccensis]MDQ0222652.1 glycerophosphoryl diester phosphodiesterase [Streptococcus moroccensis]